MLVCVSPLRAAACCQRLRVGISGPEATIAKSSSVGNVRCATVKEMPFYQYNAFTGRLKTSTGLQPLYPVRTEPPVMIYDTIKTKPVTVTPKSGYCTDKPPTLDPKLWSKYKHFQANLDKPVYLAGGKKDKYLFGFTVAYVAVCTLQSIVFMVKEGIMDSTK